MKASLFYLPSIGSRAEIEAGMAGMNPDFYQRMLKELSEQIRLGDELGYDSVSFTEHHFHIEGFELSNNPVLLDLYFPGCALGVVPMLFYHLGQLTLDTVVAERWAAEDSARKKRD